MIIPRRTDVVDPKFFAWPEPDFVLLSGRRLAIAQHVFGTVGSDKSLSSLPSTNDAECGVESLNGCSAPLRLLGQFRDIVLALELLVVLELEDLAFPSLSALLLWASAVDPSH